MSAALKLTLFLIFVAALLGLVLYWRRAEREQDRFWSEWDD